METGFRIGLAQIILVVIVAVGFAVRLYEVNYNFDGDEIFSVQLASQEFSEVILSSLQDRPHPPLHNVLLHLWMKAFGSSEVSARTLSVLLSGFFLVVSYVLLRRLVTTWLALGILSIFALSPLFVYYGQQARPYALIACLASVNLLAFIRALDTPVDRRRLAIWAASCALLLYAQYMGIFIIAFQIALALVCLRSGRQAIFAYGAVGVALILPWLIAAMGSSILAGVDPLPQISTNIFFVEKPSPIDFGWFYVSIFGECPWLRTRWLFLLLVFLGLAYGRDIVTSRNLPINHALLFVIGVGVPIVVYLESVWGPKPVFVNRQMLGSAVAFVAATGLCLSTLPRSLAAGLLLALLVWTITGLSQGFPYNIKPPLKEIAEQIDEQYGTIVVVTQERSMKDQIEYYRKSGSVQHWSEIAKMPDNNYLFVCRPVYSKCSKIEIEPLKSQHSLVATKRWGIKDSEFHEIRIYEIGGSVHESRPKY